jgi:putative flippase GtrA
MHFRNLIKFQFIRFILVGIVNTLFGYGCFAMFLYVGLHFTLAAFLATICGVIFNFKSTGTIVFGSHDNSLIFRFFGSYSIIYLINIAGLEMFYQIGVTPYIGGAILIFPLSILSFILNKRLVFNMVNATP